MIMIFLFTDQVKEGTNAAIVQNDNQADQNGVKGTHKDKVNRVVYPLECKWKHGSVLPMMDLAPSLEERSADTDMKALSR
jgi:hypothetical protein